MSDSSMDRMMREAQQRMNDMYSRRSPIGGSGSPVQRNMREQPPQNSKPETESKSPEPEKTEEPPKPEIPKEPEAADSVPQKEILSETKKDNILEILLKDKDRTIILCLILLLMDENADHGLLLALLYLLM